MTTVIGSLSDMAAEQSAAATETTAQEIWAEYQSLLLGSPDFAGSLTRYFSERSNAGLPNLATLVPILLAESFHITEPRVIESVTLGSLFFDHWAQIIDDLTDESGSPGIDQIHLVSVLFAAGTKQFTSFAKHPAEIVATINLHLHESMKAERYLWRHHHRNTVAYERQDVASIGSRCSFMQTPIDVYADIAGIEANAPMAISLRKGFAAVAIAIQLVDDIIDCEKDYVDGIYTMPIVLAGLEESYAYPAGEVGAHIVRSGALETVLLTASDHLKESIYLFSEARAIEMAALARSLRESIKRMLNVGRSVKSVVLDSPSLYMERVQNAGDTLMSH